MAHDAVRILYRRIGERGAFDAGRLPEYRSWTEAAVAEVLPDFEKDHGPFLRPMFEAYVPKLRDRIGRLLNDEAANFDRWEVGEQETPREKEYPGLDAVLTGRPDRVARSGSGLAVIDYKKRALPRPKDVIPDPDGELAALQVAAYVLLCETGGNRVERARYWSLEDAAALDVLGPGAGSREDYGPALETFERYLAETADRLRSGDFRPPRPEARNCEGCGWQAVCRARYATE
jgi:RecB family exonuclease